MGIGPQRVSEQQAVVPNGRERSERQLLEDSLRSFQLSKLQLFLA